MRKFSIVPCKHIISQIGFLFFVFGTHDKTTVYVLGTMYLSKVFCVLGFLYLENPPGHHEMDIWIHPKSVLSEPFPHTYF